MPVVVTLIAIHVFEAGLFYYYCENVFTSTVARKFRVLAVCAGFALLCGLQCFNNIIVNAIAILTVSFLLMYFIYKGKVYQCVFQAILFFGLMSAAEYLVVPLDAIIFRLGDYNIRENYPAFIFAAVMCKLLHFLLMMIALLIFKKKNEMFTNDKVGLGLSLLVPLENLLFLALIEYVTYVAKLSKALILVWEIGSILMLVTTLLVFYNRTRLIRQAQNINALNLEKQRHEFDAQYYAMVEQAGEDMRILSHDFKNHLLQLKATQSREEMNAYIDRLFPALESYQAVNISDNRVLNTILGKYLTLSRMKGVEFRFQVTEALHFLEPSDLSAILGNLLDNALEAAQGSDGAFMELHIEHKNEKLCLIMVENSCRTAPTERAGAFVSTKPDAAAHGLGLKSVQKCVEKYGGFFHAEYREETGIFRAQAAVYKF